jgi:hypothetical protein
MTTEEQKKKNASKMRKWRKDNSEHYRRYKRDYNKKNITKISKQRKNYREKLRLEVLIHYGGNPPKCACCGESEIKFLTIDHINNDGARHRKKIGIGATRLYYWLKKNNFPLGFQVLCYNCNQSKSNYGVCPHVKV